jgi:hypothetical protein
MTQNMFDTKIALHLAPRLSTDPRNTGEALRTLADADTIVRRDAVPLRHIIDLPRHLTCATRAGNSAAR